MKLLQYLLENNLVPDERTGRGLVMRGDVLVNDKPVTSEHAEINQDCLVRIRGWNADANVSRGADKLRPVVERIGFDCSGQVCLDLGVATGGFTQVLLEQGASTVYAVDVAYGTIALELRDDPRVVLLERTNVRDLASGSFADPPARIVGDLSFISWRAALPTVMPLVATGAEFLLMVKPQFELAARGRGGELEGGVVESPELIEDCMVGLYNTWQDNGLSPVDVIPAGVRGAKGNREFFVYLTSLQPDNGSTGYVEQVRKAIGEVQ